GLIVLLLPFFMAGFVYAQKDKTKKNVILPKEEIVNKDYFAVGDTVTLAGTVNGDAYIAGGIVNIEGQVNGDLIAAGGTVNLKGNITNDARVAGGEIVVSSQIDGNLTVLGGSVNIASGANVGGSLVSGSGNLNVFAPVGKGATIGSGNVTLGSTIDGDVVAGVGQLILTPNASVAGNLTYWSDQDVQVQPGAEILGQTTHNFPPKPQKDQPQKVFAKVALTFKIIGFISALIIGFLLIRFLPVFTKKTTETINQKFWNSLGLGFLSIVLIPIVFIILILIVVTIPLALMLLVAFLITLYLAKIFVALWVGQMILQRLDRKLGDYWTYLLGLVVIYIVTWIPIIGWLVGLIVLLTGVGALQLTKYNTYKQLRSKNLI
ncbi:hypothetical protein A2165_02415, partial [Candidatus Curtissbacteria bacterium RBG_13_40_7]